MQPDLKTNGLKCSVRHINLTHSKLSVSWTDKINSLSLFLNCVSKKLLSERQVQNILFPLTLSFFPASVLTSMQELRQEEKQSFLLCFEFLNIHAVSILYFHLFIPQIFSVQFQVLYSPAGQGSKDVPSTSERRHQCSCRKCPVFEQMPLESSVVLVKSRVNTT